MVPEAVPGVMLPTDDGTEEAFVPADLLEYADTLLTSSSTLNPTVVLPTHGEAPVLSLLPSLQSHPALQNGFSYRFSLVFCVTYRRAQLNGKFLSFHMLPSTQLNQ